MSWNRLRYKNPKWLKGILNLEKKRLEQYKQIDITNLDEESIYRVEIAICKTKINILRFERLLGLPYSYQVTEIKKELRRIKEYE